MTRPAYDADAVWRHLLSRLLAGGEEVRPRGQLTKELPQATILVDLRRPVVLSPGRKLSYKFMAAEAFWILSGDATVAGIAPYNEKIRDFSDDGQMFFGAYGPKIVGQLNYVVSKLLSDPDTRQAGLTIWRENPPQTKDYPCTVAVWFQLRHGQLNCHVFMRSSDAWLGVPYDVFNFAMLTHLVCCRLNAALTFPIHPGCLFLTMASSHLYERDWASAQLCTTDPNPTRDQPLTPDQLWTHEILLIGWLKKLRDSKPGDLARWWE